MKKAWLCDVDGTVALMDGRGPFDWDRVGEDKPNEPVLDAIRALIACDHEVWFITGRMEQCRAATCGWLLGHLEIREPLILLMRADGDYRPDDEVKLGIYREKIEPERDILGVFDDRDKVVAMWRSLGLVCLQVAEGNF